MARVKPRDHARDRILSDDELRAVWKAAETLSGPYGFLLLLAATRHSEAADMTRRELSNGDWIIPAARMKGKLEHVVPLSAAATALLDSMPNLGAYVFSQYRDYAEKARPM
jgi:integrase